MSKQKLLLELRTEEKELLETLEAVRTLIKRYQAEPPEKHVVESMPVVQNLNGEQKPINSTNLQNDSIGFDTSTSIPKKVLAALRLLGKGTSRQVAEKLFELDKSKSLEQWVEEARYYLSLYYNEKNPNKRKLIVIKDDTVRGNVYAFPI